MTYADGMIKAGASINIMDNREFYELYQRDGLKPELITIFQGILLDYYRQHGRQFPWRETYDPYHILVSEIMLQQTQTSRVVEKYTSFFEIFPDIAALAEAPLRDVLGAWQGLGYNRRGMALHNLAKIVVSDFGGVIPSDPVALRSLPGIGKYTAAAVSAIAFNKPAVAIDTNIRTVYHYFFFPDEESIPEKEIEALVEATIDKDSPREWYYALFDYGVMLKQQEKDKLKLKLNRQSRFKGSDREIRGKVIRMMVHDVEVSCEALIQQLNDDTDRVNRIINQLQEEGFIDIRDGVVRIKK